jgi:hypothetical protein
VRGHRGLHVAICACFARFFHLAAARRAADQISFAADQFNKMRRIDFLEDKSPGANVMGQNEDKI